MPSALLAILAGAAAAYMLDPVQGRRRRALVREKMATASRQGREFADAASRDFRFRAQGIKSMLSGARASGEAPEEVLVADNWSPAVRVVSGGAASALVVYGLTRGGPLGLLAFIGGGVMLARTIANRPLDELANDMPAKAQTAVAPQQKQPWAGA